MLRRLFLSLPILLATSLCSATCDDGSVPGGFPFSSDAAAASVLTSLQRAISREDNAAVADLVQFPVRATLGDKSVRLRRNELLANFNEVFNQKVKAAILAARFRSETDYQCVFWNDHGMMLGDGEVWLNSVDDDSIKVITINND
ncbi:hypothetical protein ELE36_09375 [Pseudolysobacter antarcticus]|uniref:Nuclear transport factor 2 family protein n=1 Tax=Pseudolysobacter antarcticus TaxID=2511995 RepID=A0A411HJJ1_9GAMM|nr:hypothetical protein [Pseudolysobacter antarcticus]QBB70557.1 hypothetical protein ELE36_09375 [Pseudolysobacter antarcticus]